jgi:GntR family histidine utilization transcriptional repressor
VHLANAKPFAIETRLINLAAAPEAAGADFESLAPGAWLLSHVAWTEARHQIAAINLTSADAAELEVAETCACLSVKRWTWRRGVGVTYARQVFPGGAIDLEARFTPGES